MNSNKHFKLSPVPHLTSENAKNLPLVTTFCHIYANFYGIQHILLTVSLLPAIYHKVDYYLPVVVHIFPSFKTLHHFKYTLNIYITGYIRNVIKIMCSVTVICIGSVIANIYSVLVHSYAEWLIYFTSVPQNYTSGRSLKKIKNIS